LRRRKDKDPCENYAETIMKLNSQMSVRELLTQHPSATAVLIKRKVLCVGCPAETFHTIEDIACIHGILLEHLLRDLRDAIDGQEQS